MGITVAVDQCCACLTNGVRDQVIHPDSERSVGDSHYIRRYFTEYTHQKGAFYAMVATYVSITIGVVMLQPLISIPCNFDDNWRSGIEFENPLYERNACRFIRSWHLLWFTIEECMFGRRIVASVILGSVIGWERRGADRPAGIRTMSLVSLGSCLFTITSAFAFESGPMGWDASRISAAIPSGVGFLGAGLIFKQADKDENGQNSHVVHGLTTAASVWLSAAVGIACGGGLYFAGLFSTCSMLLMLRFGPRNQHPCDEQHDNCQENDSDCVLEENIPREATNYGGVDSARSTESQRMLRRSSSKKMNGRALIHRNSTRPQLV